MIACDAPTDVRPTVVRVDPAWVTGAAAAAVDPATGLFIVLPIGVTALTRNGADSAALASVRFKLNPATLGNGRITLEEDRGGPIAAWNEMKICGRAFLVESPFGAAQDSVPRQLSRFMGPAWTHTICGPRGDAQVAVHTADVRTGVRYVGADYMISDLDSIVQVHLSVGIPVDTPSPPWPSPEAALKELFQLTGVPIAEVPRPQRHWLPTLVVAPYPLWRLTLSVPVEGLLDNGEATAPFSVVYARMVTVDSIGFFIPSEDQPTHVWGYYPTSFEPLAIDSVQFPVLKPIVFRRVRPH